MIGDYVKTISLKKLRSESKSNRVDCMYSLAKALHRLHQENIVNGNLTYDSVAFKKFGSDGYKAYITNYLYASKVTESEDVRMRYDVRCFGIMMIEGFLGRKIDSMTSEELDRIIDAVNNANDKEYLELAKRIVFDDIGDIADVLRMIEEIRGY